MHLTYRRMVVVLALAATIAAPAWAQQQTGSISGRAEDTSGAALPGVTVSITSDNLIGGARMGTAPDNSVVDSDHRIWGVPNVLITDGSVCPTQGSANPALTIMALASRLAERLGA